MIKLQSNFYISKLSNYLLNFKVLKIQTISDFSIAFENNFNFKAIERQISLT